MVDHDIPPPNGRSIADRRLWWEWVRAADRPLSRDQFRHVLAALNKLPLLLYEVVPVPRAEREPLLVVGYAVLRQDLVYNDVGFDGDNTPIIHYRTRAEAAQEAVRRAKADPQYRGPLSVEEVRHWQNGAIDYVVVELPFSPER